MNQSKISDFISAIQQSVEVSTFIKISMGNYEGEEVDLKKIRIDPVIIKDKYNWKFTYHYKTKDTVKNHPLKEGLNLLESIFPSQFLVATLFTTEKDIIFENIHNKKYIVRTTQPSQTTPSNFQHDHVKQQLLPAQANYLHALGITNAEGNVLKSGQRKYKQINHYIRLLQAELDRLPADQSLTICDMGSGKGYLTFALYHYLTQVQSKEVTMTGIELRPDLITLCNSIAEASGFNSLHFVESSIADYSVQKLDILIALHACDTATDDAITTGILSDAQLIVVAPCCQKQIRKEIEKNKKTNHLRFLTQHGIYLERIAEMVTDGIRTQILEHYGYKVKVVEFIADAHTHKNVMIIATKTHQPTPKSDLLARAFESMAYFGIEHHHLLHRLGLSKSHDSPHQ